MLDPEDIEVNLDDRIKAGRFVIDKSLLLAQLVTCVAVISYVLLILPPGLVLPVLGILLLVSGLTAFTIQRGQIRIASLISILTTWGLLTAAMWIVTGEPNGPISMSYILLIAISGLALGRKTGAAAAGLSILAVVLLVGVNSAGLPPAERWSRVSNDTLFSVPAFLLTTALISVIDLHVSRALLRLASHEEELLRSNQELQSMFDTLEQRVQERIGEIQQQRLRYEALEQNNLFAVISVDEHMVLQTCNTAFLTMFGYERSEAIGANLDDLVASDTIRGEAVDLSLQALKGETVHSIARRYRKDGSPLDVEIYSVSVMQKEQMVGLFVLYYDVTERVKAETERQESNETLVTILDGMDADVYVSDMDTFKILLMNKHMQKNFGGDLTGKTCYEEFRGESVPCAHCSNKHLLDANGQPAEPVIWEGQNPITGTWYLNFDRAIRWVDGKYVRLQVATDITRLKEAEQRLKFVATHDPLTKLPNRMLYQERLNHALTLARRNGKHVAVLFLDLDKFKEVNDNFGHEAGDILLQNLARRIQNCIRESDTVARLAGDEFTFILENIKSPDEASAVTQKLLAAIAEPFAIKRHKVWITASIGISCFPQDGDNVEALLRRADRAMYHAKKLGKNQYHFYRSNQNE